MADDPKAGAVAHSLAIYDEDRHVVAIRLSPAEVATLRPYLHPDAQDPLVACYPVTVEALDFFVEGHQPAQFEPNVHLRGKSLRFVIAVVQKEYERLIAVCEHPDTDEDERADAGNDGALYGLILKKLREAS